MQTSKPHMFGFMSPEKNMISLKTYAFFECNMQLAIIMNSELLVFNMISLIIRINTYNLQLQIDRMLITL